MDQPPRRFANINNNHLATRDMIGCVDACMCVRLSHFSLTTLACLHQSPSLRIILAILYRIPSLPFFSSSCAHANSISLFSFLKRFGFLLINFEFVALFVFSYFLRGLISSSLFVCFFSSHNSSLPFSLPLFSLISYFPSPFLILIEISVLFFSFLFLFGVMWPLLSLYIYI